MLEFTTTIVLILVIGYILSYAYWWGKIDFSAIVATAIVGFLTLYAFGNKGIIPLLVFFVVGNLASHYKKSVKRELGVEQSVRTWRNVFGNGGATAFFALHYLHYSFPVCFLGLMGAMACACGDTFATELGQVYGRNPRLVTSFRRVDVGVPGAVSLAGLGSAFLGSGIISLLLIFWGYSYHVVSLCLFVGFFGSVFDSVLGATLEKWRFIDTHSINFITTLFSGWMLILLAR